MLVCSQTNPISGESADWSGSPWVEQSTVAMDPGLSGIVCASDLGGVFPWMIVVISWSQISCPLLVLSLSSIKRGPDNREMWELEACVICKGTCGELALDNRSV